MIVLYENPPYIAFIEPKAPYAHSRSEEIQCENYTLKIVYRSSRKDHNVQHVDIYINRKKNKALMKSIAKYLDGRFVYNTWLTYCSRNKSEYEFSGEMELIDSSIKEEKSSYNIRFSLFRDNIIETKPWKPK